MSILKAIHNVIRQMFGARTPPVDLFDGPDPERFPTGGGWAVTVTRGPRTRRAFPSNVAKRDAAVADKLKSLEGKDGVLELDAFRTLEAQAKEKGYRFEK